MQETVGAPPLSRPFIVGDWRDDEAKVTVVAEEQECEALATALGLPRIKSLTAEFTLTRRTGGRIEVRGQMAATIIQICVVSLDPFESEVSEPIEVAFAPEAEARALESQPRRSQEIHGAAPIDEPPDPIVDGRIDLGVLAAEFLALGLDPYPRKPGIDFAAPADAGPVAESPFAMLGRLKKGREESPGD